jgi:hypothetical protein
VELFYATQLSRYLSALLPEDGNRAVLFFLEYEKMETLNKLIIQCMIPTVITELFLC